ncbi:hypothetical protein [Ekhidna sp.]
MPNGFVESEIIPNEAMEYEYAIEGAYGEVRFAIRPITLKEYASEEEEAGYLERLEMENSQIKWFLMMTILNLSNGIDFPIKEYNNIQKDLFNASWAGAATVLIDSDFSNKYKYCHIICIHKKDKATSYIFYLSENMELLKKNLRKSVNAISYF